jgi:uncharacterized protein YjdB
MNTLSEKIIVTCMMICTLGFFACREDGQTTSGEIAVKTVSAMPGSITLAAGGTRTVRATVIPEGANQVVYWMSNNEDIVTVTNGILTGISEGETTITVTSAVDPTKTDVVNVTVTGAVIPVDSVRLNKSEPFVMYIGDDSILTAFVYPENADNRDIIWHNSNPEAATFENGIVHGVGRGTTVITAFSACDVNLYAALEITVTDKNVPVEEIVLPVASAAMPAGKSKTLTPTVLPADATDKTLSWESDNPGVATVDNGVITANAAGTAVITVKSVSNPDIDNSVTVTVCDLSTWSPVAADAVGLWIFDYSGDFTKPDIGQALTESGDGFTAVDGPAGASAVRVARGSYFAARHGIAANGGGTRVNEYSVMFDCRFTALNDWYGLLETDMNNGEENDIWIDLPSGKIGCGDIGYSSDGTIPVDNNYHRLVITVKLPDEIKFYVDGTLIFTTSSSLDHIRRSLDTAGVLFFADASAWDTDIDAAAVGIWDKQLTDAEVASLGGI